MEHYANVLDGIQLDQEVQERLKESGKFLLHPNCLVPGCFDNMKIDNMCQKFQKKSENISKNL